MSYKKQMLFIFARAAVMIWIASLWFLGDIRGWSINVIIQIISAIALLVFLIIVGEWEKETYHG